MFSSFNVSQLFLLLTVFAPIIKGLETWNVTPTDFVSQKSVSTIIVGNWLYIDGGQFYDRQVSSWAQLNQTLSIDLSVSWKASTVVINAFDKPADFLTAKSEALWRNPNSSTVLAFGGQTYGVSSDSTWALSPDGQGSGSWLEVSFDDPNWQSIIRPEYGLVAASSTTGYSLGGIVSNFRTSSVYAIPGMVTYDFASGKWNNLTVSGAYSATGMGAYGVAQFVPSFGAAGLIIMMGGIIPNNASDTYPRESLRLMSNITIFDAASQKWYSQTATGDVPPARNGACIVGAQGLNSSTYEIFVYGGWGVSDGTDDTDSSNVYILMLPAFRWIRVTGSAPSRADSSCQLVGNRQMLSVGGWDTTFTADVTAETWPYGLGLFDITALSWSTNYDAKAEPYVRSDVVSSFYATHAIYPSSWDDPDIEGVFNGTSATNVPSSTGSSPHKTSTETSMAHNKPSTPTAAIAGGVVGGVAALGAIVGLWWFCAKRRRTHKYAPALQRQAHDGVSQQPYYVSEMGGPEKPARPVEIEGRSMQKSHEPVTYHEVEG